MNEIVLSCPSCRATIGPFHDLAQSVVCPNCQSKYHQLDGIWHLLTPEREAHYANFLDDYAFIRKAEGRGSTDPAFYHRLPSVSPSTPYAWQWHIRANSYRKLIREILPNIGEGLQVLDLGAGNGWLSNRLFLQGHFPTAMDINIDPFDGLAAARHYSPAWPRIRAEFNCLPISDACVNVAIFNASIHYSDDYDTTFSEALRVLKPNGSIIIMDSPIYKREHSGQNMSRNRKIRFKKQYNRTLDAIQSHEYLTWKGVAQLAEKTNTILKHYKTWHGTKWALRKIKAALFQHHEPPSFAVLVFQRRTGAGL